MIEDRLKEHLGDRYRHDDWRPAFDAVFAAEHDTVVAVTAIEALASQANTSAPSPAKPSVARLSVELRPSLPQLKELECDLMQSVSELHTRKHIHGAMPTLKDLLNPLQEDEVGDSPYLFPGGDDDIIAEAVHMTTGCGEEEIESDEDGGDRAELESAISAKEGMLLCERMERLALEHSDADGVSWSVFQQQLRRMRGHL